MDSSRQYHFGGDYPSMIMGYLQGMSSMKLPALLFVGLCMIIAEVNGVNRTYVRSCYKDYNDGLLRFNIKNYWNDEEVISFFAFDDDDCGNTAMRLLSCSAPQDGDHFNFEITATIPIGADGNVEPDGTAVQISGPDSYCGLRYRDSTYSITLMSRVSTDMTAQTWVDQCKVFQCRLDDAVAANLDSLSDSDNQIAISAKLPEIRLVSPQYRMEMYVKHPGPDHSIMETGSVYDDAYLQIEMYPWFYPTGPDTVGNSFHFAFIDAKKGDGDFGGDKQGRLLISTTSSLRRGTTVKIESPLLVNNPETIIIYEKTTNDFELVLINEDDLHKGSFKVTAEQEISVVAIQRMSGSIASFTVLPDDALGLKYYGAFWSNDGDRMQIVASQDNTNVDIHMPEGDGDIMVIDGTNYREDEHCKIKLDNENDFKYISNIRKDSTGCIITSDKPIAVIVGQRLEEIGGKGEKDHIMMQLPPAPTFGRGRNVLTEKGGAKNRYIIMTRPSTNGRQTQYKIVSVQSGNTEVQWYKTPNNVELLNQFTQEARTFYLHEVDPDMAHEIYANAPIMIIQFTPSADNKKDFYDATMIPVLEVGNWASRLHFGLTDAYTKNHVLMIATRRGDHGFILLDGNPLVGVIWKDVVDDGFTNGASSEFVYTSYRLPASMDTGFHSLEGAHHSITLYAILYSESYGQETFSDNFLLPGMRVAPLAQTTDSCPQPGLDNDGLDNDCDGRIDEEERDGIDNDGDMLVDEDTFYQTDGPGRDVAFRAVDCYVSANSDFSPPSRKIVNPDGCLNMNEGAFSLINGGFHRITKHGQEPVIAVTGDFELAKFSDPGLNYIYFGCNLEFCEEFTDDTCNDKMCSAGIMGTSRRKRETSNTTINMVARVHIVDSYLPHKYQQSQTEIPEMGCVAISTFVIVAVVLVVLLLLTAVTAVYLTKRLRK
ncbi:hypothetical protein ScPMuIL_007006 [Solemya velum]